MKSMNGKQGFPAKDCATCAKDSENPATDQSAATDETEPLGKLVTKKVGLFVKGKLSQDSENPKKDQGKATDEGETLTAAPVKGIKGKLSKRSKLAQMLANFKK